MRFSPCVQLTHWGNNVLVEIREWIAFVVECLILLVVWMEYRYDKEKDDAKKHRKTKTTKKTTNNKDGESVVEESTEVSEPIGTDWKG